MDQVRKRGRKMTHPVFTELAKEDIEAYQLAQKKKREGLPISEKEEAIRRKVFQLKRRLYCEQNGEKIREYNRNYDRAHHRRKRPPLYADVGSRIREIRKSMGLTQTALAKHLGISKYHLSEVEAGYYKSSKRILEEVKNMRGVS